MFLRLIESLMCYPRQLMFRGILLIVSPPHPPPRTPHPSITQSYELQWILIRNFLLLFSMCPSNLQDTFDIDFL